LDGATARKYARTRHNSDDIARGRRQQEVVFAVRDRVLSRDMLDDLITQAPALWNDLQGGVETGLALDQSIQLVLFAKDVPRENIHNAVVGWDYLTGYKTEGGAQVVIPDRWRIGNLLVEVFGVDYNQ
jgi:anionic cell wall polymer biosynthesis LytR-Cps2A-Psr (LCP) family protein